MKIKLQKALELIMAQQEWIMTVPVNTQLPAMPGFSAEEVVAEIKEALKTC